MPLAWNITDAEVAKVKVYVASRSDDALVRHRIKCNLTNRPTSIGRADFWYALIYCLLTTQQKSGPKSPITEFSKVKPFPLSLDKCQASSDVRGLVLRELTDFGGIRRTKTVAGEIQKNLEWLDDQFWPQVD